MYLTRFLTVLLFWLLTNISHAQRHHWEKLLDTTTFTALQGKESIPLWIMEEFDLDTQAMANPDQRWNRDGIADSSLRVQKLNWIYHHTDYYLLSISAGGIRNNTVYILASKRLESAIYICEGTRGPDFEKFRKKFIHHRLKTL